MKLRILTLLAVLCALLPARAAESLTALLPADPMFFMSMRDNNLFERAALDFLMVELAGADRVAPGQLGRSGIIGDRLDLEDVEPAKFGDLLERQRAVVDQPGGGRMGHERLGHGDLRVQ